MAIASPTVEPATPLSRAETFQHQGFRVPDPFAPRQRPGASFVNAVLATALFRCWHYLIFFAAWATLITILNEQGHNLNFSSVLLTVVGTVLGFIISYRTTSSFERYNEGRKLWSTIVLASRTMSRTIWFHVPNNNPEGDETAEDARARSMIEKKSAINLLEAFAVAVKHYLRGEDGIYYQDLYYLVKFLPAYALPAGMPSMTDLSQTSPVDDHDHSFKGLSPLEAVSPLTSSPAPGTAQTPSSPTGRHPTITIADSALHQRTNGQGVTSPNSLLPPPVSSGAPGKRSSYSTGVASTQSLRPGGPGSVKDRERILLSRQDEDHLLPGHLPPTYGLFDLFPFSLLVPYLTRKGDNLKGKRAARFRAKLQNHAVSHNIPLELSLYLGSYVAKLQERKLLDVPTNTTLMNSIAQLLDSLTGLERILTTPIPFSYAVHLWLVTILYCLALPFQIWTTMKWVTIPATILLSFIFFGFMVAGEEIENPFGYDKNDLNLDHFTQNIIRNELRAVTSTPPPDVSRWAFVPENNLLFSNNLDDRVTPAEWLARGLGTMQKNLGQF
ncbi:hypothetical protein NLJ89_g7167 [Agrocybe chaxingu]|uniref:Uncharacterized protein n=1 Tax=Agrocybe chaxingu TaxID=84603 RepID=A0A9W8JXW5_9AGAR|nr:hypothetical protein NLJ89_g7167 [Agrocybe chaxingu]